MEILPLEKICPFPIVKLGTDSSPIDGCRLKLANLCGKKLKGSRACFEFYGGLCAKPDGAYQCHAGFTSIKFTILGRAFAVTGILQNPPIGGAVEKERRKLHPELCVSKGELDAFVAYAHSTHDVVWAEYEKMLQKYPTAFHELRKLNGAIKQRAEIMMREDGETEATLTMYSSAELISNNLDLLDAITNPDALFNLPTNNTIILWDLAYKCKKVYQRKAEQAGLDIWVEGPRVCIEGSKKSFPTILTVLIDNAIKYSIPRGKIDILMEVKGKVVRIRVTNATKYKIDPKACFEKGNRQVDVIEGSGHGLYIAQLIATQHRSRIVCDNSRPGFVSFYLDVPFVTILPPVAH